MKTVIVMGVDKRGHKVDYKVSFTHRPASIQAYARDRLGLVKVTATMSEAAYNRTKEIL